MNQNDNGLMDCPLAEVPLAVLDVETTGLYPEVGDRVVEVALLLARGFQPEQEFSTLVNPGIPIDEDASCVNGITDDMVCNQPTFADVLPRLDELLSGRVVLAHNARFDLGFLVSEYTLADREITLGPVLDTVLFARRKHTFPDNRLETLVRCLGITNPDPHRAMGDVLATYEVFQRFADDLNQDHPANVSDWLRAQGGCVRQPANCATTLPDNYPILTALARSCQVRIRYRASGGAVTERLISPQQISGEHLVAWCDLRADRRTFRIDRIELAELVE